MHFHTLDASGNVLLMLSLYNEGLFLKYSKSERFRREKNIAMTRQNLHNIPCRMRESKIDYERKKVPKLFYIELFNQKQVAMPPS